jgi:hypothetical protein
VGGDSVQPAANRSRIAQRFQMAMRPEERILRQIFRFRGIPNKVEQIAVNSIVVRLEERPCVNDVFPDWHKLLMPPRPAKLRNLVTLRRIHYIRLLEIPVDILGTPGSLHRGESLLLTTETESNPEFTLPQASSTILPASKVLSTGGTSVNRISILLSAVLSLCPLLVSDVSAGRSEKPRPVVLMMDRGPSGFTYILNSKPVSGDLLLALTKMGATEVSSDSEAILLVHEDVKISAINNLIGIMAKAGLVHPRVFFFRRDKELMTELTYSKAVPFSAEGRVPEDR